MCKNKHLIKKLVYRLFILFHIFSVTLNDDRSREDFIAMFHCKIIAVCFQKAQASVDFLAKEMVFFVIFPMNRMLKVLSSNNIYSFQGFIIRNSFLITSNRKNPFFTVKRFSLAGDFEYFFG